MGQFFLSNPALNQSTRMIFNKLYCFVNPHRSTTIIFRQYWKKDTRPFIMPKDNKNYLRDLQKQRQRIKAQQTKYAPSKIFLQVIGNGSRSGSRSVMLSTDHSNYLFNCGEGTQRLSTEFKAKLTKVENIFITRTSWENMGGIPGMSLTVQDSGVPKVTLHGPEGTFDIIQATQGFITLSELTVIPADISRPFSDQTMTLTYVPIDNPNEVKEESPKRDIFLDNTNYYEYRFNKNGKRTLSPTNIAVLKDSSSAKSQKRVNSIMNYVCEIKPRLGTLDYEKCVMAGVTPGPDLGLLKAGQDVVLPNGKIVRSADVTTNPECGPLFIVMECPDESWIDVVTENPIFKKHQEAVSDEKKISYIVHFTPESVLNDEKYRDWMRKFGEKTEHLIINEKNDGIASEAMFKMQHQLHLLHPTIFPFFGDQQNFADPKQHEHIIEKLTSNAKISEDSGEVELAANENVEENEKVHEPVVENGLIIRRCKTLNAIQMRPLSGFDPSEVQINPKAYVEDALAIDGILDTIAELQTQLNAKEKSSEGLEEYPKVLMLGTGSSVPNKVRNTSGILLQLSEDRSIILDCGESTITQIVRFFGESEANRILKTIKAIYVSHLHADHHIGLIGILNQRKRLTDEPVFLLAPHQIISYLDFYNNRFEPIRKQFRLVSNRDLLLNQKILSLDVSKDMYDLLDVSNISTSFVSHCPFAYGVAITLKDGRKICYSGDTMPCESFSKLAQGSFLLIHEATIEDELENEALVKRHSTISQAINVGLKAEVNFTLLTHFSQRYSKIPVLPSADKGIDLSRVGIAYDFMYVSLSQLEILPLFYPSLGLMFSEFRALLDEKAAKREYRKEFVKVAN